MAETPIYRVEFRDAAKSVVEVIAVLSDGHRHHSTLDPYISSLLQQGRRGILDLIDVPSGCCIARRRVIHGRPAERVRPHRRRVRQQLFDPVTGIPSA